MYCSKCGTNLAADAAFCGSCGNPTGRSATTAPPQMAPPVAAGAPARVPYADPAGLLASRGFTYAGFWARFFAYVIDSLLLSAASLVLFVPLLFLTGMAANFEGLAQTHGQPSPAAVGGFIAAIMLFVVIAIVLLWLYHAYLESGEKQATWGKQALGIYVTDLNGHRITFANASGRFFAKIISGLIPLYIGYIMAAFTERRQAQHDMIASTLVLRR